MKKKIAAALAATFALGVTSAFAANPFVDVPAKHWAYDSVNKLAQAGIIDGYGDGTFKGQQNMTRYEMAQIVAKAMAKSDKANAEQKAMINKLSAEFNSELNNLGVRVGALEKNASKIKIEGESRVRFSHSKEDDGYGFAKAAHTVGNYEAKSIQGSKAFDWRQRLHLNAQVTPDIKYTARLEATGNNDGAASSAVTFNRNFFTVSNKLGVDQLMVGKMGLYAGNYLAVGKTSSSDGVFVKTKAGQLDVDAFWTTQDTNSNFRGLFVSHNQPTYGVNAGYMVADELAEATSRPYAPASKAWDVGVWWKLSKGWYFVGEYVDTKNETGEGDVSGKAWAAQVSYNWTADYAVKKFFSTANAVDITQPHQQAVILSYRSVDKGGLPGLGHYGQFGSIHNQSYGDYQDKNNVKAFYIGYQNVMQKNVLLNVEYADFKAKEGDWKNKQTTAYVQFFF